MTIHETPSGSQSFVRTQEYSPRFGSRRLRLLYFGAASLWGFVIGVAGLLVGLGLTEGPAAPTLQAVLGLIPAAGIAIAGAGVIAGAYEEVKRRRR